MPALRARVFEKQRMMIANVGPWRALGVLVLLVTFAFGGLYITGLFYEPGQRETSVPVPNLKVRYWHDEGRDDEHQQATN